MPGVNGGVPSCAGWHPWRIKLPWSATEHEEVVQKTPDASFLGKTLTADRDDDISRLVIGLASMPCSRRN